MNLPADLDMATPTSLRLPNLLCVGSARCGTSFLYGLLQHSSQVALSPQKEANYFGVRQHPFARTDALTTEEYAAMFSDVAGKKYVADVTPVYLSNTIALQVAKNVLGDAKVIITLREPIARAKSHYRFHREYHGFNDVNDYFSHAMRRYCGEKLNNDWYAPEAALRMSLYYAGVSTCMELFGRENCLVLFYEDLAHNADAWTDSLEAFLGVTIRFDRESLSEFVNQGPETVERISPEVKGMLLSLHAKDIAKTSQVIGRDLFKYWYGL